MAFKSVFTVLTDKTLLDPVLDHAIAVARAHDAHLDVLCLGVDRSQAGYYYAGANAMILQETIERAKADGEGLEALARARLDAEDLRWGVETGMAQLADIGRHVATRARFSDLVILPQPYGQGHGAELEPVLESALFDGRTPILVVPTVAEPCPAPQKIMIGWNESPEALAAVRAALPLIAHAETVHVVVVDPPAHGPSRSDPGGMLSQYIARHGAKVEIDVLSKTLPRIADVLVRHAGDVEADMIVMGGYGHSRFREAILGGATRYMLEEAKLPVFMAH